MTQTLALMRSFSIRTRMQGAVLMVLAMFALVGLVGVVAGLKIQHLNQAFMDHSVRDVGAISTIRQHLSKVRLHEKQMVIDYEDGVAVLQHREAWTAELEATRLALTSMLEGEEDADNPVARESIDKLAAYTKRSDSVLANIQNGAYDNARVADRGRVLDASGAVVKDYSDTGLPAVLSFEIASTSAYFTLEVMGNRIHQGLSDTANAPASQMSASDATPPRGMPVGTPVAKPATPAVTAATPVAPATAAKKAAPLPGAGVLQEPTKEELNFNFDFEKPEEKK